MTHWEGVKQATAETCQYINTIVTLPDFSEGIVLPANFPGPQRKTTLEQEFY